MIRFTLFGIPIRIEPFFWVTMILLGGALHAKSPQAMFLLGLFVIAGFISILVHELGHALTARRYGAYSEITLQAFGGYAAYSGVRLTRPQTFAVTAAGPALQILLGVAAWAALPFVPLENRHAIYFLTRLQWISIAWAILNLLPILPLDGGRLLETLLGPQRIKITLWVTIVTAIAVGLALLDRTGDIIFPLFLGMFAWQAFQALKEIRWL